MERRDRSFISGAVDACWRVTLCLAQTSLTDESIDSSDGEAAEKL